MTDKKNSRRKLLKSIAAGSGAVVAGKSFPESWSKPVINSIVLPVHATTTEDIDSGGSGGTTTSEPGTTEPGTTATPPCSIAAGCIQVTADTYMTFGGGVEGDYFAVGTPGFTNSSCSGDVSIVLGDFAIAASSSDADIILSANGAASIGAANFFKLSGTCQVWFRVTDS